MKVLILAAALLAVSMTQAAPSEVHKVSKSNPSWNVDKENDVVTISNNMGWKSWDAVLDYKTGFLAARIFSRKACVVVPWKKAEFPSAEVFPEQPVTVNQKYSVWQSPIHDLAKFGKSIEALCSGIQTFPAVETGDMATFSECANSIIITIFGITFCF